MKAKAETFWSVYIVECGDGSLYCGVATDVERRIRDHAGPRGARYVKAHGGVAGLRWTLRVGSRSSALRVELWIKKQTRGAKQAVIREEMPVPAALLQSQPDIESADRLLEAAPDRREP